MTLNTLVFIAAAVMFLLEIFVPGEFPFMLVGLVLLAVGHIPMPSIGS